MQGWAGGRLMYQMQYTLSRLVFPRSNVLQTRQIGGKPSGAQSCLFPSLWC